MLVIWSGAKSPEIKKVFGQVLTQTPVEYRIHPDPYIPPDVEEGDVVLACGSKVLEALMGAGLVPKNRTVTSMREKPIQASGATIIITYDPNIVSKDYARLPELVWDCRLACRLIRTGSTKPLIGEYQYVESFHNLINRIEEIYAETQLPVAVACDLETLGLDEYDPAAWIITIQLSVDTGKSEVCYFEKGEAPVKPTVYDRQKLADLDYWEGLWVQINWILTSSKVSIRGANYKFDSRWLNHKWGIYTTNHKFDTLLVGSLLDENRSNSLKLHAKIYTDLGGYEDEADQFDFSRVDLIPKDLLLNYAGGDTDATLQVAEQMRKELRKDKRLTDFYINLLHPSSKVFEKMERNGVLVDEPYYNLLQAELEKEKTRLETAMVLQLPDALYAQHKAKIELCLETGKNPMGSTILKDYLFTPAGLNLKPLRVTEKTKQPSTAIDHLLMFGDNPVAAEFVQVLKEYGSVTKTLSTYVIGFLKHLRSDGRFHPSYMLFRGSQGDEDSDSGAVTGRTSAKSPAVQCMTKDTLILTNTGYINLLEIVQGYEKGIDYKVLTHTGTWEKIIGVYRNGIKAVFSVSSERGIIRSTENHPYLTKRGWVRTDELLPEDIAYAIKREWDSTQDAELHQPDLLQLGGNEKQVYEQNQSALSELRRSWYKTLREVDDVYELSGGYEGEALQGVVNRATRREWGLHEGKLYLGNTYDSVLKQEKHEATNPSRGDKDRSSVGKGCGYYTREVTLPPINKYSYGASLNEGEGIDLRVFQETAITGVTFAGYEETYDLTIENSHSFVANGIVVHNTIVKHSKWAKPLRRAFIAPAGKTILQCDYAQGELKIAACVANEPTMILAYQNGIDLHAITAATLNSMEYEEFMEQPEEWRDAQRSLGKAGNFGLLYGMSAGGFKAYAENSYGVKMTDEEATNRRNAFFDLYPKLLEWHETYRQLARENLQVVSPLGRVRHLPLIHSNMSDVRSSAERQAINSPIQSTLSDLMQLAMVYIDREYGQEECEMFLMTHDSLAMYIPVGQEALWAKRVTDIMSNLPITELFGWKPQLKFTADAEVSAFDNDGIRSLASLKKFKDY